MDIQQTIREAVRQEAIRIIPDILSEASDGRNSELLDVQSAAAFIGMSATWLNIRRSQSHPNHPPFIKIGRRVLYRRSDLEAWLKRREENSSKVGG